MRDHRDLRLVTAAAVACALLALASPIEALSLLFAGPLAFLLPGYAIVAAVFVRKPPAWPQLAVLSIGLSLAVLALGALVLNYAPGGIRGFSWALLLVLVTAIACRRAALRRPKAVTQKILALSRPNRPQAAACVVGALAATAALVLAFTTLPAKKAIGYTELWIQPYAANGGGVRVGIGSNEQHPALYRLRVSLGREGTATVRRVALQPGESRVLHLPLAVRASSQRVTAELFRAARPGRPYRRVSTWVPARRIPG